MSVLTDLGSVLTSAGLGTAGTDLFFGQMPLRPVDCIALLEYGGSTPTWSFNQMEWEQPRVQVLVRTSQGYTAGRAKAHTAWSALSAVRNQRINSIQYQNVEVLQSPFPLARDEESSDITFVFNVEVWKQVG